MHDSRQRGRTALQKLRQAGIKRIVFGEFYRDQRIFEVARRLGIELVHLNAPAPVAAEG